MNALWCGVGAVRAIHREKKKSGPCMDVGGARGLWVVGCWSYRIVSYRIVSYRIVSYRVVPASWTQSTTTVRYVGTVATVHRYIGTAHRYVVRIYPGGWAGAELRVIATHTYGIYPLTSNYTYLHARYIYSQTRSCLYLPSLTHSFMVKKGHCAHICMHLFRQTDYM